MREMNMKILLRGNQRGQSLVLVALLMITFLGILGLVLDGGNLFSKRRAAQNAADAGALAGARTLCITEDEGQAEFMAQQYATVHNEGGAAVANADLDARTVDVTATIQTNTYFIHYLGFDHLTAQASAAAGCFSPDIGEGVLPVAWACRPPISGGLSSSEDCQEQWITDNQLQYYISHPPPAGTIYPELYIIMDSSALPDDLSAICMSQGGWLDCDLDDDGDDDLVANGDRSWLDLDGGGGGSSELVDWINGVNVPTIEAGYWLGGQPGVANNVFQAVGDREGDFVIIPVFSNFCDDYPDPQCSSLIQPDDTIITSAGGNYYYRIVAFALFYISCVDAPGVPHGECDGHRVARDLGVIDSNTKTIEGYFVRGFVSGIGGGSSGGGGLDLGAYTLYLTR